MANFPKAPPSIGRPTGLRGATGAAGASGSGLPGGWIDVTASPYNADRTGATDSSAGIQAAINAAISAGGGTVYFPLGTYTFATTLVVDRHSGIRLMGAGPSLQYQSGPSKLVYTGAGARAISFHSTFNCEIYGLDFQYNNAAGSFTGDYLDFDGAPLAADVQNIDIHHCGSRALATNTARSIIRMNKVVIMTIRSCHLTGALDNIRVGDAGGSYVNVLQVEKCCFNFALDAMIFVGSADCETLTVRDCTFEAGTNTTGIRGATTAVDGAFNECYSPVIEGNWFGDASTGVKWVDGLSVQSNSFAGLVQGNRFSGAHSGGTHLNLAGRWNVISNSMEGGDQVYDSPAPTHLQLVTIGNYYNIPTNLVNPTNFVNGTASLPVYYALGNIPLSLAPDVLPPIPLTVTTTSNSSYTLVLADAGDIKSFNRGGATLTIPPNASVAFPVGTQIAIAQNGSLSSGTITVAPGSGVTVTGASLVIASGGAGVLYKIATDQWVLLN